MFKQLSSAGVLIGLLALALAAPVSAQGPIIPQHSDPTWHAQYFANTSLSGSPVLIREDANINFDWGTGSPGSGIPANRFSVRWTRYISVTPGTYRFTVTSDDGIRVWIDNVLLLDKWYDHSVQTFTFDRYLGAGHHHVRVDYYENTVFAVAKLSFARKEAPTGDWDAQYFNNMTLSGTLALTRKEPWVSYNWGAGSPAPGVVNADHFSARWTRTVDVPAGMYHFSLTIDDGARLWVNGHRLIDAWYDQAATTYTGDIYLPGGAATIQLEYYENGGYAVARLIWDTDDGPPPTPPPPPPGGTVIVDDTDPGFTRGGAAAGWRIVNEGYDGRLLWTWNNYRTRPYYNWARWYPDLAARHYEVFVYIPWRYTTTARARYWIRHADGYTLRVVDQNANGDRWVSLGTYRFRADGSGYVSLADVTFEPYRTRLMAFDAVKWVPR